MKKKEIMYVVRKYVMAESVAQAIKREPKAAVHKDFVDEEWQKKNLAEAIGFHVASPKDQTS